MPAIALSSIQDRIVELEWTLSSAQVDVMSEEWLIKVQLESVGPGPEYALPSAGSVRKLLSEYDQADPTTGTYHYTHEIDVPANTVASGRYWILPTIHPVDPKGKLGSITGFGKQTMLKLWR